MLDISVLIKPASGMCNMSCDYCFYADEQKNRETENYGFMSFGTLKNVIRKTMANAERSITFAFQGGEPTLRGIDFFKEVIRLENRYNRRGIKVQNAMQTNGYDVDEKWCEFLHDNHFLAGLSVDGTKECHDAYRHTKDGKGTSDRICRTAELFDRYGVEYNILTVVNRKVAAGIEQIYAFYKKKGWRYLQFIPCLEPFGAEPGKQKFSVTPEQYGTFLVRLYELWYEDYKKGEQPYIRQFENYAAILMGYLPEACDQRGTCGLQHVVEADGTVYPCDFYAVDEYRIGNFNENTFAEIQKKRDGIRFVERSENISGRCGRCDYYRLCRGGCQRNRVFDPETETYHNYFCESYQMLLSEFSALWKE